jgi:hypothetical protein
LEFKIKLRINSLEKKPIKGGTPANENIQIDKTSK